MILVLTQIKLSKAYIGAGIENESTEELGKEV